MTFYETIKLYSNKKSSNLFDTRLPKEIAKDFPRFWAHPEKIDKNLLSGGLNIKKRELCVKGILAKDLWSIGKLPMEIASVFKPELKIYV